MVAKLKTVNQYLKGTDAENFREALRDTPLAGMKVARYLSRGNDAYVIELAPQEGLPDGGALKLVNNYESGWNESWGKRPYDAKILMKGKHWEVPDGSGRDVIAYVQELVTPDFEENLLEPFQKKLAKDGVKIRDPGTEGGFQFGKSLKSGKLVLVDYEAVDKNDTLENLIGARDQDSVEEREKEREREEDENADSHYDAVDTVESLRGKSEAYPPDSWQAGVFQELSMGSNMQDASLSYVAWKAKQGGNPADVWTTAVQKEALSKTKELAKEARKRGLLH
jgi:hypothetical protein